MARGRHPLLPAPGRCGAGVTPARRADILAALRAAIATDVEGALRRLAAGDHDGREKPDNVFDLGAARVAAIADEREPDARLDVAVYLNSDDTFAITVDLYVEQDGAK
jgi:hypothetical protein